MFKSHPEMAANRACQPGAPRRKARPGKLNRLVSNNSFRQGIQKLNRALFYALFEVFTTYHLVKLF
jgi:hypothetical protein